MTNRRATITGEVVERPEQLGLAGRARGTARAGRLRQAAREWRRGRWERSGLAACLLLGTVGLLSSQALPAKAIVNGTAAAPGAYPWMTYVRIFNPDGVTACGGTLVAPTWVMSATHCFSNGSLSAGGANVFVAGNQTVNTGGFQANVVELRREPKFGPGDGTRWDVVLLRLDRVIPVAPVRLATANELPLVAKDRRARVVGWGFTSEGRSDDPTTPIDETTGPNSPSQTLRQADIVIGDPALGSRFFPGINDPNRFDPDLDLIEREGTGGQHACRGDSGGPMLVDVGGGDWRQVANLSWGNCARDDYVNSWNRLISGPHREWLDGVIHGQYGYLHSPHPASGIIDANRNSGGPRIRNSFVRTGTGAYELRFPGLASGGGVGHVSPDSRNPGRCWVSGWGAHTSGADQTMGVRCSTLAGEPADIPFTASYGLPLGLSARPGAAFAQLWADRPTTTSYEPTRSHVMTSNGSRPRITRVATGLYGVELPGLASQGVAKVTAVGGSRDCVAETVASDGSRQRVTVRCTRPGTDGSMQPVDSGFSLTFVHATGLRNSDEGTWAYLLADRPMVAAFTPTRQKASTGAVAGLTRTAVGRYQARLPGLADRDASVQVSSMTSGRHCHASNGSSGRDALIDITCSTRSALWGSTVSDQFSDAAFSLVFDAAPRPSKSFSDFDGDGKKDQVVFRPSDRTWHGINSSDGSGWWRQFGNAGDMPMPADYDGDGRTDIAVARPRPTEKAMVWYWISSRTNTLNQLHVGRHDDIPTPGDYDGDGRADQAVWRPSTGTWTYRSTLHNRSSGNLQWGNQGDRLVHGDWDGDGRTDPAVFRPTAGRWYTTSSRAGTHDTTGTVWGSSRDRLAPADYDGDGTIDHALFNPSRGTWKVTGPSITREFGVESDYLVPGDYDGDRKADIAVWRPGNGTWYRIDSSTGKHATGVQFGRGGDIPLI